MLTEGFTKFLIGLGILAIAIGFIMFCFNDSLFQFSEQIKADKVGQLGDFVGGIAGSIWALAGVILFYLAFQSQKAALDNQRLATQASIDALKLQTQEIALQREELTKSTEAQNKSQIALNHQLKSMQLTSQIDILNQYLLLIKNKGQKEHEKASSEIIHYLTNQIFYNPEYEDFVKPKFEIANKSITKVGNRDERYNHAIKLKVLNTGIKNIKLLKPESLETVYLVNKTGRAAENANFEFKYTAEKENRVFVLEFEGIVVPNKFSQTINVYGDEVHIGELQYIEKVYDS